MYIVISGHCHQLLKTYIKSVYFNPLSQTIYLYNPVNQWNIHIRLRECRKCHIRYFMIDEYRTSDISGMQEIAHPIFKECRKSHIRYFRNTGSFTSDISGLPERHIRYFRNTGSFISFIHAYTYIHIGRRIYDNIYSSPRQTLWRHFWRTLFFKWI